MGSESWGGVEEATDHQDEFSDDEKHTTVIVEAVGITRDGLHKLRTEDDSEEEPSNLLEKQGTKLGIGSAEYNVTDASGQGAKLQRYQKGPKKRKKKFRYESKAERKMTRQKERSGNKAKARGRKS